jgi:DnaK suppressor protein
MTTEPANTRKLREQLMARRASLLSRYQGALDRADEELAVPAHELVDIASNQWDAQLLSVMSDADAQILENIAAAIGRLDGGSYGYCAICEEPIDPARLGALPEAVECVDCVRFAEDSPPRFTMSIGTGA